ncbi:hypothetical protein MBA17_25515 [Streptosporangium sp. KLBMP 9127]|nr:hypothetical protein [Streptosporangium sp. KLBMP 9127]
MTTSNIQPTIRALALTAQSSPPSSSSPSSPSSSPSPLGGGGGFTGFAGRFSSSEDLDDDSDDGLGDGLGDGSGDLDGLGDGPEVAVASGAVGFGGASDTTTVFPRLGGSLVNACTIPTMASTATIVPTRTAMMEVRRLMLQR